MNPWPDPRTLLDGRHFDVVIIGGGINGVAIARECAAAGRSTLLVEQNDFASGTTSRSTRIIHGGLRYLEHGEIGLVRESLRERQRLLKERPHLVRPMRFVLALPPGRRSTIEIRLGLWLYRTLAGRKPLPHSSNADGFLDSAGDDLRVFSYDDAQCEFPERLVAEWLVDAMEAGATARNHTRALAVETSGGRVRGVRLRDALSGSEYRVGSQYVINATGPWADQVCRESEVKTASPMIGGVRGSHIVLPRFAGAPTDALYTEARDGRPIFVIPWNGQVLIGSTEINDHGDPSGAQPSAEEIEYLVSSVRRLFPAVELPAISRAFAGVRPLPYAPGTVAGAVTRRHFLRDHAEDGADGLISVIGGKLTTAAHLARQCARRVGVVVQEPAMTAVADASALEAALGAVTRDVATIGSIPAASARGLVSRHGAHAIAISQDAAADDRLCRPLVDGSSYLVAEAIFAVRREAALTLADVLLRRVPIALGTEWSDDMALQAASRIGDVLEWDEQTLHQQVEACEEERSAFLVRPAIARITA